MVKKFTIFIFFLFFATTIFSYPRIYYKKYETKYSILYFPNTFDKSLIPFLVKQVTRSEKFIEKLYGWKPKIKTVVVFNRELDSANGWSRSFLKPKITLYVYPPEIYSTLANYKNFELNLFVHEYTHFTQMSQTNGFASLINFVFGNLFYPNSVLPVWLLEGTAVFSESEIEKTGRLHSLIYKSMFNSFFYNSTPFELSTLNGFPEHWLGGANEYLFGTFFYNYLMEEYGSKKISKFYNKVSKNFTPFFPLFDAKPVFGKYFDEIYKTFLKSYKKKLFKKNEKFNDYFKTSQRFSKINVDLNAKDYQFGATDFTFGNKLYLFNGFEIKEKFSLPSIDDFALKNNIFLSVFYDVYNSRFIRKEIFLSNLKTKQITKLTYNFSAYSPVFCDKNSFFYISYKNGINKIIKSDLKGTILKEILLKNFDSIFSLSVSPNKTKLVFSGNLKNKDKNIFLLDLKTNKITEFEISKNQYSVYFVDNKTIIFSSDFKNNISAMKMNINSGKLKLLSNLATPVLYPKKIKNKLFFTTFDNKGFFLAYTTFNEKNIGEAKKKEFRKIKKKSKKIKLKSASFFEGLLPSLILPDYNTTLFQTKVGLKIFGDGNTDLRNYSLYFSKNFDKTDKYYTSFSYFDQNVLPGFNTKLVYSNKKVDFKDNKNVENFRKQYFLTSFSFYNSFSGFAIIFNKILKFNQYFYSSFGFSKQDSFLKIKLQNPFDILPEKNQDFSLHTGITYLLNLSFGASTPYLYSQFNGLSISFPFVLSQNYTQQTGSLFFSPKLYIAFSLSEKGYAFFNSSNRFYLQFVGNTPFSIGGEEKDENFLSVDSFIFGNSSSITVRGYKENEILGKNVFLSNNELRFHILTIDKGLALFPFMLKNLQGAFFFDYGTVFDELNSFDKKQIFSCGSEFKLLTYFWFRVPILFKLGIARGLTENGVFNIYFGMGNSF